MSLSFYEGVETKNKRSPGQTDHGLAIGLLRSIRGKTIVDIGCGIGNLAREFAKMNNTVIGIDTDKKQIEIANKNIADTIENNISFVVGKGEETEQKNNSVDIVLFSHSLHHIETPHIAIKESHRILKKGGMIIVLDLKKHEEFWMRKISYILYRLKNKYEHQVFIQIVIVLR
jgi:ArsR family transcriptional regulator